MHAILRRKTGHEFFLCPFLHWLGAALAECLPSPLLPPSLSLLGRTENPALAGCPEPPPPLGMCWEEEILAATAPPWLMVHVARGRRGAAKEDLPGRQGSTAV